MALPSEYVDDDICVVRSASGEETFVFDPYNPLNHSITKEDVESILRMYGIQIPIHNLELYKRAFIHKSYIRRPALENEQNKVVIVEKPADCLPLSTKSNERLEFVGDGVLECFTKYYLYRRFSKAQEGFMTEKKIELVKNESIGKIAHEMGLHRWYVLSKHAETKQTRTNLKKLGCLFEAFVGAIFLDFNRIKINDEAGWFDTFASGPGFQMAELFIQAVFERHVDWTALVNNDNNYKNILQVIIQKEYKVTPHYLELTPYQGDGAGYHMGVYLCLGQAIHEARDPIVCSGRFVNHSQVHEYMSVNRKIFLFLAEGKHKIKKKAEQIACESAIKLLKTF
jgi:dsRNA-specific ribonuclease